MGNLIKGGGAADCFPKSERGGLMKLEEHGPFLSSFGQL